MCQGHGVSVIRNNCIYFHIFFSDFNGSRFTLFSKFITCLCSKSSCQCICFIFFKCCNCITLGIGPCSCNSIIRCCIFIGCFCVNIQNLSSVLQRCHNCIVRCNCITAAVKCNICKFSIIHSLIASIAVLFCNIISHCKGTVIKTRPFCCRRSSACHRTFFSIYKQLHTASCINSYYFMPFAPKIIRNCKVYFWP